MGTRERCSTRVLRTLSAYLLVALIGGAAGSIAQPALAAEECASNAAVRAAEPGGGALPDCRAYEQVSPMAKNGSDALGAPGAVESSPDGSRVTYFSVLPFPGVEGAADYVTYLGTRQAEGWSSEGLLPRTAAPLSFASVIALTPDLGETLVSDSPSVPALAPGSQSGQLNYYLRDNASASYQLLAASPGGEESHYADATPNGQSILFESREPLLPGAPKGVPVVYAWSQAHLVFASVLPNGHVPEEGAIAGAGAGREFYTEGTLAEDGERAYFTDRGDEIVYLRDFGATETKQVSAGPAHFVSATPDGLTALYEEEGGLFRFTSADAGPPSRVAVAPGGSEVAGVVGSNSDASIVYFVARSALAGESTHGVPMVGSPNLYEWTAAGGVKFLATLNALHDEWDWLDHPEPAGGGGADGPEKSSRVTPSGGEVLFSSTESLTGYANAGENEIYLYDAATDAFRCVSCAPSGQQAHSPALLSHSAAISAPVSRSPFLTRNLSTDGRRVIFQTEEALVPDDTNEASDVYEWEEQGSGSCRVTTPTFDTRSEGCLFLLSSGRGVSESSFADASSDGSSVFIFSRDRLVTQDADENADLYDVREGGGFIAQNTAASVPDACESEACRATGASVEAVPTPASMTLSAEPDAPRTESAAPARQPQLSRAAKLKRALRACHERRRSRRRHCEVVARRMFGQARHRRKR